MQLKKINNTLKKILCSDDKNTQRVHNKCCTSQKSHFWCHFIILILTRTGLHKNDLQIMSVAITQARLISYLQGLHSTSFPDEHSQLTWNP